MSGFPASIYVPSTAATHSFTPVWMICNPSAVQEVDTTVGTYFKEHAAEVAEVLLLVGEFFPV